jgi:hypothetical protein
MPTPFASGLLNRRLFELRREPVLREARPIADAILSRRRQALRAAAKVREEVT